MGKDGDPPLVRKCLYENELRKREWNQREWQPWQRRHECREARVEPIPHRVRFRSHGLGKERRLGYLLQSRYGRVPHQLCERGLLIRGRGARVKLWQLVTVRDGDFIYEC